MGELLLYGLQWLAITIPVVIIIGQTVAGLHFSDLADQVIYIQKLFFIVGLITLVQLFWGHRLPVTAGPAAVLLVGIVASQGNSLAAIYSSILVGGVILSLISITGLFGYLKTLFTPRVVATVLILIAFTLAPMIIDLITSNVVEGGSSFYNIVFALVFILVLFVGNKYFKGIWKSSLIILALLLGSLVYFLIFPKETVVTNLDYNLLSSFLGNITFHFTLEPALIISFLICFIALAINDLGSVQSVGEMVNADNMETRITRGITVSGLGNILAGFFGVIGPVNFSISTGVVAATRCASRYVLIPMGVGLVFLSFIPNVVALLGNIPSVVTGSILIYIMSSQIAAGLVICTDSMEDFKFEHGLAIGLPLMIGVIISFLPAEVLATFPDLLRPILGNGFVMGVFAVLIMEHVIFKEEPVSAL